MSSTNPPQTRPAGPRLVRLLGSPLAEWPHIAAEPDTVARLMALVAAPLCLIAPVCAAVGGAYVGVTDADGNRVVLPLAKALVNAGGSFVITLASVWLMALIIEALAPRNSATVDRLTAVKLAVWSSTPSWLVGVFFVWPPISFLGILGLYSVHLFWTGLPVLTRCPAERQPIYAISVVFIMFGIQILAAAAMGIGSR